MESNRKPQTAQEALFSVLFKEQDEQIQRLNQLKVEVPAAIAQSVDQIIERTNVNFQNLNNVLHEIMPEIEKAISAETAKAQKQVGTLVEAASALNRAAGELTDKRLAKAQTAIDETIKDAIDREVTKAFEGAVSNSISNINTALEKSEKKVANIAREAEQAAQGSLYTRLATMFAAGLVGALLAVSLFIVGINKDLINVKPVWDSRGVAIELFNHFKK